MYKSFVARGERVYIWAIIVEMFMTVMRNGAGCFILIRMVLDEGLSVSQFLLYLR
jgi:ATP-binding cassette subfamily B protein